ncbi:hypothetical protein Ddye_002578 [Dipteronia dyeriana]|uniref:RING-type E3 ubiquitin transferase n=1 Tax=Dipteronia dyeriana TaxID=168575 RepID=A0AAD9XQN3_9ROSI|nr:hypothetical protein Ddye_002578 [Dipteronia dyeriana]
MDHYHCEAYQPVDNGDQEEGGGLAISSRKALLCIEFYVSTDGLIKHGNLTLPIDEPTTVTTTTSLSWSVVISGKLSELHLPYDSHMSLIMTITNCARSIINEDRNNNNNCHVIPMVVMITDAAAAAVTSSESCCCSIQAALEKTRVEDCSRQCVICLEEISVGSEATRMPCSHVYHQDCIVTWLKQSNLCPLCRFQIPVNSFLHS